MSIRLRIFLAFVLSMVTLTITLSWYYLTEKNINSTGQEILAEVVSVSNEVNRRQTSRLLWSPLDVGDQIANGESIRTQSDSDVKLIFKDGTELQVEPDTFVVISKKEKRIGLNLLEGSLFAKQSSDGGGGQIVIESTDGDSSILTATQSVISKDKNSKIQLSSLDESSNQSLVILSPKAGLNLYIKPNEKVTFNFKAPEGVDLRQLKLRVGSSRKKLSYVNEIEMISQNQFNIALKEGANYIQLLLEDDSGLVLKQTPILRYNARLITPPIIVFPRDNGEFKIESNGELSVQVKEESLIGAKKTRFQITGPNDFKAEGDFDSRGFSRVKLEPGGPYQLSAFNLYDESKFEKSESIRFHVLPEEKKEKPPFDLVAVGLVPKIETPLMPYSLLISWALSVRQDEIKTIELESTFDNKTFRSKKLNFKDGNGQIEIAQFGEYKLRVIGLDEHNKELAFSPLYTIEFVQTPFIGPVTHRYQNEVLSDSNGRLVLNWDELAEAHSFLVILKSDFQKDFEIKSPKNEAVFEDLLPGHYMGLIIPIDKWGRRGLESQRFHVRVPEISSIRAPTSKRIKIR